MFDMNLIKSTISSSPLKLGPPISKPFLNRKILGLWCPIMIDSKIVSGVIDGEKENVNPMLSCRLNLSPDFLCKIERTGGRVMGVKNHYGWFDKHLEEGESLTIRFFGDDNKEDFVFKAKGSNEVVEVGNGVRVGGIEYISEYVMVGGGGRDVWMKVEEEERERFLEELRTKEEVMMVTA
ncbi:hypothetical protein TL16_g10232 [Triparma laevis f. inornata]|uniref:Uncharacterized protein n=2 Tax=Triparma laevis TaxID=1534972 RepID=A0A9W7ASC9_9STRA|nr:hypothetical protein TrLO_g9465 [Triparma laevis f. longispina]GMH85439.1 hypothetical protein TL16_g10232 [Triparma laevis f. inornata]